MGFKNCLKTFCSILIFVKKKGNFLNKKTLLCADKVTLPSLLNRILQHNICDFN